MDRIPLNTTYKVNIYHISGPQSTVKMDTFIGFKDEIPVYTETQVEFFGTVVLGLETRKVKQIIAGTKEKLDPSKAAADLLQMWLKHKTESTAQDILNTMEKSGFSKQSICSFEKFMKVHKCAPGMALCLLQTNA